MKGSRGGHRSRRNNRSEVRTARESAAVLGTMSASNGFGPNEEHLKQGINASQCSTMGKKKTKRRKAKSGDGRSYQNQIGGLRRESRTTWKAAKAQRGGFPISAEDRK